MSLDRAPVKTPGICAIKIFRQEDVVKWPEINPATGIISSNIQLKAGAYLYFIEAVDQARAFEEGQKSGPGGLYFEMEVRGVLRGSNAANILSLGTMIHHQWGIIVEDRNGVARLIGNQDTGAELMYEYTSGDLSNSRKTSLSFKWIHPAPAPVYTANAFDIVIGGVTITTGRLQLLLQFKVGATGAPMNDGDTLLINNGLKDRYLLILADGISLPINYMNGAIDWSGSIQRHVEKALASNTANFIGAVRQDEIIEVYAFEQ